MKDVIQGVVGLVIFVALRIVDAVQTIVGLQQAKRALTDRERALLRPIFGDSLDYPAIQVVGGRAGLLGVSGRAFTMGPTIYLPDYSEEILVHECAHVWQFVVGGFRYIGNSVFHQLDAMFLRKGYQPYDWTGVIDGGERWEALASVEAQAQFVQDLYRDGEFVPRDPAAPPDTAPGAFFREGGVAGTNRFRQHGTDYTTVANDVWRILRAG